MNTAADRGACCSHGSFTGWRGNHAEARQARFLRHSFIPSLVLLILSGRVLAADELSLAITLETQTRAPVLQISGLAGTSCRLEYTDALSMPWDWQLLSNMTLNAAASTVVDRTALPGRARFYRASRPATDSGLLLWVRFDGNLQGVEGESPLSHQGVSYRTGKAGQAAYLDTTGRIRYAVANSLEARQGTIEFWIQPDWDGTNKDVRVFFEAGDNFNRGLLLSKDGLSNLRFLQWGDDPATPAVESSVERGLGISGSHWLKGQWYHLAFAWNGATRELACYLDGELMQTEDNGVNVASFSTTFLVIGAETDNSHPAVAAFDELRIFNRMRTAAQIWQDFQDPSGAPN